MFWKKQAWRWGLILSPKCMSVSTNVIPLSEPCRIITPLSEVPLEKLLFSQLVKKLPKFWRTNNFTIVFGRACHFSILSLMNAVCAVPSYLFNIDCNVIFPYTPRSSKLFFPSSFQPKSCMYFHFSLHATCTWFNSSNNNL